MVQHVPSSQQHPGIILLRERLLFNQSVGNGGFQNDELLRRKIEGLSLAGSILAIPINGNENSLCLTLSAP